MIASYLFLALLTFLPLGSSRSVPTRTLHEKPHVARNGAIQTPTLTSDFMKNGISAEWAEGHPMQWGSEIKKFEYPVPLDPYSDFYGFVSDDEKFLVLVNTSDFKIINLGTEAVVSRGKIAFPRDILSPQIVTNPKGGYDLIITGQNNTFPVGVTIQLPITADGVLTGQEIWHTGRMVPYESSTSLRSFSNDRRIITGNYQYIEGYTPGIIYVHSLDDPKYNLTIHGHDDWVAGTAFSPDGKYVSTASRDGYGKLWDSTSGKLVRSFGKFVGRTLGTSFSPDGQWVLMSSSPDPWASNETERQGNPFLHIYAVRDQTAEPITIGPYTFAPYKDGIRSFEWSPNSQYLAIGTYGVLQIYDIKTKRFVQTWSQEDTNPSVWDIRWLKDGKRLAFRINSGISMYDFETNLKYWWGPGDFDHALYGLLTLL